MPVIRRDDFLKPRDSWLDVLVLDHLSVPLTRLCARVGLTPTSVSVISIGWRLLAIAAFADDRLWVGAAAYVIGLLLTDGVDGKLARLTRRTSTLGAALDYSADMGLFAALTLSLRCQRGVAVVAHRSVHRLRGGIGARSVTCCRGCIGHQRGQRQLEPAYREPPASRPHRGCRARGISSSRTGFGPWVHYVGPVSAGDKAALHVTAWPLDGRVGLVAADSFAWRPCDDGKRSAPSDHGQGGINA